jgi:hypothetical protein
MNCMVSWKNLEQYFDMLMLNYLQNEKVASYYEYH